MVVYREASSLLNLLQLTKCTPLGRLTQLLRASFYFSLLGYFDDK